MTPNAERGHEGPKGFVVIENGQFDSAQGGQGIVQGPHHVLITAYPERPVESKDESNETVAKLPPPLFLSYPLELDIATPELVIDVPADAQGYQPNGAR